MRNIEWIHKIHKTDENTENMSIKKDSIFSLALSNLLC